MIHPAGIAGQSRHPAGHGYAVSAAVAVRVAGVPVDVLDGLRCTRTWRLAGELATALQWLREEGRALSEPLYEAIGALAGDPAKPLLVALRRTIFSGRGPGRRARSDEALRALPPHLDDRVRRWLARHDQAERLRAALAPTLDGEQRTQLARLRQAVTDGGFRHGLSLGSPVLSGRLDAWLEGPADRPPDRQELLALARYLARAAVKTSPYATFAVSGFASWTSGGPALQPPPQLAWREVAELDRAVLRPLWTALTRRPEVRDQARLRVNPTAHPAGGRIWFLGAAATEPLCSVPDTPAVRQALEWVRDRPGPALAAAPGLAPLVEAGLLELVPPFDEQSPDPLDRLGPPFEPGAAPEAVRRTLEDVLTADGGSLPDKNLFWHSAVMPAPAGSCGSTAWQPACDDLDTVRRLLGLFDSDLTVKLAAAAFFRDRYGPAAAVSALELYRDAHADGGRLRELLRDPVGAPRAAEPSPDLRTLAELRARFWELVEHDPGQVEPFAAGWPAFLRAPGSVCFYVQPVHRDDGLGLVVNTVTAGYGRGLSRLHRLVTLAGGDAPDLGELRAPQPGVLSAECRAIVGGGLNLRPPTADRALDYPFGHGDDHLPVLDPVELTVRLDPASGLLDLLDRDGARIRPVHLGMTAQHWLPPWLQFLIRAFGEPSVAMVPGWVLRPGNRLPDAGVVERHPRLDVGRVTLVRACWRLRTGDFPAPAKGQGLAGHLPELARWLDVHGIPPRFFARVVDLRHGLAVGLLGKDRKPMYVDVADPLLLTGFLRAIGEPGSLLVLEEVLPDPAHAPLYGGRRRVSEYIVQVSATDG
ncbi:lantibiotic dehydratase [Nonomuraea soli]|uniref:Lantibiotic dehydratase N-terminal domain-containing protein n=1 Tax=Nonomuraea soli TaxID=1032476 RepID=A0A7W0HUU6_9ACTN|nr:lantibiotic dehydratase [Nonomuraea soli]MBA2896470.1 hypothetical protein [Nonomuraea soli]